jgi:Transglutaminase-like superfamily
MPRIAIHARLLRLLKQPKSRQKLFVEACMRLAWARLLLRFLSFRRLTSILNYPVAEMVLSSTERVQLRQDVSWAIARASEWLPGETVCFPRGIAAQVICRKRGIAASVYYGVAVDPVAGLTAHVWVQDGADGIVGHLGAGRYGVLARFPA